MTTEPSTTFTLAVLDVAGTTVLDDDAVLDCLRGALETRMAVSVPDVLAVMGLPKPVAISQLLSASGTVEPGALEATVEDVHRDFRAAMITRYQQGPLRAAEGAERVFAALQDSGVRVALDTGFSRDILDTVLARLGWTEGTTIDFAIASDEVARGRPYPDLIHRAMALAGVADARQVVKVGDTPSDLAQGLAAGCGLVVGVTYGTHTRAQLDQPGVRIVDRLADLLPLIGVVTV
jgi:phosphonatase-like hydrolase